jgi:hypothetical protein
MPEHGALPIPRRKRDDHEEAQRFSVSRVYLDLRDTLKARGQCPKPEHGGEVYRRLGRGREFTDVRREPGWECAGRKFRETVLPERDGDGPLTVGVWVLSNLTILRTDFSITSQYSELISSGVTVGSALKN